MVQRTLHAAYAKHVLREHLVQKHNALTGGNDTTLPPLGDHNILGGVTPDPNQAICIFGAGAAGLSAALFLSHIGFKNIWVLEATSRVGGRAYTHNFTSGDDCNHNYYDIGAMRIPDISTQLSTLNMIKFLNASSEIIPLVPYTYAAYDPKGNRLEPSWYEYGEDDGTFDQYMTTLLTKWKFLNPTDLSISKTFDQAFWDFISSGDQPDTLSTRGWLMNGPDAPGWSYSQTEKAETWDTSAGLFDQAFMETICDWFDLRKQKLRKSPSTVSKAASMNDNGQTITVTYTGNPQSTPPTEYAAVFNTTTFGCFQRMDIRGLNLSPDNLCGIRALSYDRATKVAIKFKTPWWQGLIPNGGVSNTDLCISNVVYPSWDDGPKSAYTIIVSYSWAQDATRMASLMQSNDHESTDPTDPIVQLCPRDLVTLWSKTEYTQTIEGLQSQYEAHHAFSWSHDQWTAGGYALFGPGQFQYLYPQFTKPLCGNKFSICGEAVSAHHAWISGALDSSYNAVYAWCAANGYGNAVGELKESPFAGGKGENTAELDEKLLWNHLELAKKEGELALTTK